MSYRRTRDSQQMDIIRSYGDNTVLHCNQPPEEDLQPILREEVEIFSSSTEKGDVCRI